MKKITNEACLRASKLFFEYLRNYGIKVQRNKRTLDKNLVLKGETESENNFGPRKREFKVSCPVIILANKKGERLRFYFEVRMFANEDYDF